MGNRTFGLVFKGCDQLNPNVVSPINNVEVPPFFRNRSILSVVLGHVMITILNCYLGYITIQWVEDMHSHPISLVYLRQAAHRSKRRLSGRELANKRKTKKPETGVSKRRNDCFFVEYRRKTRFYAVCGHRP